LKQAEEELKAGNRENADKLLEAAKSVQGRIDSMKEETTQISSDLVLRKEQIDNPDFGTLIDQKAADEQALSNAQTDVSKAQAALEEATKTADTDKIEAAENTLKEAKAVEEARKKNLANSEESIKETTEYKIQEVNDKYSALIAGTVQKGGEIDNKISNCASCSEKTILEKQMEANEEYIRYLEKRQWLELCQVDPECNKDEEKMRNLQTDVNNQAQVMRNILKVLTDEEMKRNVERTFNVSRVFSLEENEKDKKKELRDVVDTIADWLIMLVSSLAVTTLIIGGFMMIISGGDENRLETGKTIFVYSLIGLTVTLLSFGIITFVQSLFY
jgi:hypothetical protein